MKINIKLLRYFVEEAKKKVLVVVIHTWISYGKMSMSFAHVMVKSNEYVKNIHGERTDLGTGEWSALNIVMFAHNKQISEWWLWMNN